MKKDYINASIGKKGNSILYRTAVAVRVFLLGLVAMGTVSCSKDFLNRGSKVVFSDENFWTSEGNVKSYCWEFYNLFAGYGTGTNGDFYFTTFTDDQAARSMDLFPVTAPASNSHWDYTYIRKANLLLERVPQMEMLSSEAAAHYLGVARFFRAFEYANLVRHFGDVPYIDEYLDQSNLDAIYAPRMPRAAVVDSIMADLQFAAANVRSMARNNSLGDLNMVSQEVVWAYMGRVALYEGTYAKYVSGDQVRASRLLDIAVEASEKIIGSNKFTLTPVYKDLYSSLDLSGNPEVLLYKSYVSGILTHSVVGYTNSSTMMSGLTRDAVDSFLCSDGLPISLSGMYEGNGDISRVLANRDLRLMQSVEDELAYIGNPNEKGFTSSTGYIITKFNNAGLGASEVLAPNNPTDAPIFWLAEVLLNYAEARAELGVLTQGDLDATVNLLRARGGVAPLLLASVPDDPLRDADVSPLLWEIRRERRSELIMDGFREWDIRRWGKLSYLDPAAKPAIFQGAYVGVTGFSLPDGLSISEDGYILPYGSGGERAVEVPKNYLDAIPTGELTLYNLRGVDFPQNPGW
ncbi:MAG: RagB/SusD family nutrient uptake outer membrane protein [Bacteroidales bacterium]|nr:RagB/SusD family nutrient uptake outer membrane protein [Bacteroidales bacterium]